MSKQMEKLVERVRELWCPGCHLYDDDANERICLDKRYMEDNEYCRNVIIHAITRIGEAYADGELKLPGEISRLPWPAMTTTEWITKAFLDGADIFIALREEEKNDCI